MTQPTTPRSVCEACGEPADGPDAVGTFHRRCVDRLLTRTRAHPPTPAWNGLPDQKRVAPADTTTVTQTTWRLGRRPALDGIRAFAAVAVVLDHTGIWGFEGGGLGVDVFFALSGFLITSLLVEELADRGRIALKSFWLRRALRLFPALVALVVVVGLLLPVMPRGTGDGIIPTLLYFTNWQRAFVGDVGALGHTWSLGIEEQFYVLWPLVLIGLWRLDRSLQLALKFTLVGAAGVAIIRELAVQTGSVSLDRWYNGFDYRADAILIGCALALAVHAGRLPRWLSDPRVVRGALVGASVMFIGREIWGAPFALERTVAAGMTCVVIAAVIAGTAARLSVVLSHPTARWIGIRSYALYLWHYPICRVLLDQGHTPARVALAIALTFASAAVSYRFVEAPFLRLKDRVATKPVELGPEVADILRPAA